MRKLMIIAAIACMTGQAHAGPSAGSSPWPTWETIKERRVEKIERFNEANDRFKERVKQNWETTKQNWKDAKENWDNAWNDAIDKLFAKRADDGPAPDESETGNDAILGKTEELLKERKGNEAVVIYPDGSVLRVPSGSEDLSFPGKDSVSRKSPEASLDRAGSKFDGSKESYLVLKPSGNQGSCKSSNSCSSRKSCSSSPRGGGDCSGLYCKQASKNRGSGRGSDDDTYTDEELEQQRMPEKGKGPPDDQGKYDDTSADTAKQDADADSDPKGSANAATDTDSKLEPKKDAPKKEVITTVPGADTKPEPVPDTKPNAKADAVQNNAPVDNSSKTDANPESAPDMVEVPDLVSPPDVVDGNNAESVKYEALTDDIDTNGNH
ncbi:hypothetical protein ACFL6Y_10385 [Elusimicrobiota bacterium]